MSTRLYPRTSNKRNFERLAQVPEGTAELLFVAQAAEAALVERKSIHTIDVGYAFYRLVNDDVTRLRDFELFGFGRFDLCLLFSEDRDCGETSDPCLMQQLLASSGHPDVDLSLIDSLYWL